MSVERSVMPLEEALYDLGRTATYPRLPDPAEPILSAVAARPARRAAPPLRAGRPLLVAILVLLVLAGVVAAAYVIGISWLSTGPRGIQFSEEFAFAEVYRDGGGPTRPGPMPRSVWYADFAMSQDGAAIYAVRLPNHPERTAELVRLTGLEGPKLEREVVLEYAALADPALWDAGVDTSAVDIGVIGGSDTDVLAATPDGQLLLTAAAYGRDRIPVGAADVVAEEIRDNWPDLPAEELEQQIERITTRQPTLGVALIVIRPDGSPQKVLTAAELVESGLLAPGGKDVSLGVTASASDRLWVRAEMLGMPGGQPALLQVSDPNRDGDWSDRLIVPLAMPDSLPQPGTSWQYLQPTAEISSTEVDRSGSVLVPMLDASGEYRIYRVRDDNGDGDAADAGEAELIVTGQPGSGDTGAPRVASRVVVDGDVEVVRELLVSSLTGPTRISRVLEDGTVRDIARAIQSGPDDVVAAPDGAVYVAVQEPGSDTVAPTSVVYRLTPLPPGEAADTGPASPSVAPPPSAAHPDEPPDGAPRIAYTLESASTATSRLMVVSADGGEPTELVPGEHNSAFCTSADGRLIAYWSDEEVPHEPFVYVANADGSARRIISEEAAEFWCGFAADALLLRGRAAAAPIVRHDLATGEETVLLDGAEVLQASPDGSRYLAAIAGEDGTTLEILDPTSGDRVRLDGPLGDDRAFASISWSPDGSMVAYAVGQPLAQPAQDGPSEIRLVDLAAGTPRRIASVDGSEPGLALSADGRHLLVTPSPTTGPGPLLLVEVDTGVARTVDDLALFGDWHPTKPDTFAYATPDALLIGTIDGAPMELMAVPADGICPECQGDGAPPGEWGWGQWIGWSPDGRYIGLPDFAPVVGVVEVATGELRILTHDVPDAFVLGARWLR